MIEIDNRVWNTFYVRDGCSHGCLGLEYARCREPEVLVWRG